MAEFNDPFNQYERRLWDARKKYHADEINAWKAQRDQISEALDEMKDMDDELRSGILDGFQTLNEMTDEFRESIQQVAEKGLTDIERKILRIRSAAGTLRNYASGLKELGHDTVSNDIVIQANNLDILADQTRVRELESRMEAIRDDALRPIEELREKAQTTWLTIKSMTTSLIGFRSAVFLAGTAFTKALLDSFTGLRQQGTTLGGSFAGTGRGIQDVMRQLLQGRFIGLGDATQTRTGLANQLGTAPSEGLLNIASRLQNTFSMGVEESTQLAEQMYRMSGFSETYTQDMLSAAKGVEAITQIPAGDVIREMASDANIFSQYMGKAPAQIAASVALVKQLSISLQTADAFANRLTDDFESSLQLQAELQTLFPNFDLSEAQFAAQYGTPDQVSSVLSRQLQGLGISNISQLPRSIRNKLASSLGLSNADLQRALQGQTGNTSPNQVQQKSSGETTATNALYSLTNFVSRTEWVSTALGILGGAALFAATGLVGRGKIAALGGAALGGFGKFSGAAGGLARRMPLIGGLASFGIDMFSGEGFGRSATGAVGSVLGGAAGALGGGGFGSLALGTAGAVGGHKLATLLYDKLTGEGEPLTQSADAMLDSLVERMQQDATSSTSTATEPVTKQLDRLISIMTRNESQKMDIYLDGRKVGETVRHAMERRY